MALTKVSRGLLSTGIVDNSNAIAITIDSSERVGIGVGAPTAKLSLPAQASGDSGVARFSIESAVDSNDFTIAQYEDSTGTYTQIGQNISLTSGGNVAVLDSAHKTAGITFDGRGNGSLMFQTGAANANNEVMRIDELGRVGIGRVARVALDVAGEVAIAHNATYGLRFYNQPQNNWSSIGNTETSSSANMVFKDASGEVMRLSGGRVGIGTSAAQHLLQVSGGATDGRMSFTNNARGNAQGDGMWVGVDNSQSYLLSRGAYPLTFYTNATQRMRIDSTGKVGIGTASPSYLVHADATTATDPSYFVASSGTNFVVAMGSQNSAGVAQEAFIGTISDDVLKIKTNNTERVRLDTSGRLLVNTSSVLQGTAAKLQVLQTVANEWSTRINNSTSSPFGLAMSYTGATPNSTSSHYLYCADPSAVRFFVVSNGTVGSATSSFGGTSDLKLKENIVDAGSQWDDLKAVRVRKYSFKEENSSEPTQIGVIAQEVEAAGMAGLVYETPDQDTAEDGSFGDAGEVTKNIKYSILYMKAVKALQEAMTRIETLEAKVQTLENN
jgi:hypothetical protein